jgi:hypothetical protein
MSLILAVEPDRRRAAQLSAMAHDHLDCEFLVASSGLRAIEALSGRIPDVLLAAPLLPPAEEAALEQHLRQLGAEAAHVPTLAIPLFSTDGNVRQHSVMSRLRRERPQVERSEGCPPALFAEQICEYLARAREGRKSPPAPQLVKAPVIVAPPVVEDPPIAEAAISEAAMDDAANAIPLELSDFVDLFIDEPAPPVAAAPVAELSTPPVEEEVDLSPLLEDAPAAEEEAPAIVLSPEPETIFFDAPIEEMPEPLVAATPAPMLIEQLPPQPQPVREAPPFRAPIIDVVPEPAAPLTALVPAPQPVQQPSSNVLVNIPTGNGGHVQASVNVAVAVSVQVAASVNVVTPPSRRSRKPKPVQDEWGFFDPTQCGFPALMAKLDEIAEKEESD